MRVYDLVEALSNSWVNEFTLIADTFECRSVNLHLLNPTCNLLQVGYLLILLPNYQLRGVNKEHIFFMINIYLNVF